MKKIFIVAALVSIFVSCNSPKGSNLPAPSTTSTECTMAFVNMERVLTESDIFLKEGVQLQQRSEASHREWSTTEQKLQSEALQLQQKFQNGLITTANAQKEQQALKKRAQEYGATTQKEMQALEEENSVFASRAQKLIMDAVANINNTPDGKRYKMIVNASTLIDADSTLDISSVVLEEVNNLYKKEKR